MILTLTVVGISSVAVLYWAQSIFIPIVLGAFLTFLLSPIVSALGRRGLRRAPAVILTVFATALVMGVVGWIVTEQISGLLRELPRYSQNIRVKARSLRNFATGSSGLARMVMEINHELASPPAAAREDDAEQAENRDQKESNRPATIYIERTSPPWLSRISSFLAPLLEYLSELALAIVLVLFMLQKREELRNRIIRLVGHGQIAVATRFVDESGQRISRFLLNQAVVNCTFGLVVGLALLALGVKYALLCGFLAAVLRYLPYIGPYIAALFPITISLAMFDGWGTAAEVAVIFLALELIVANVLEPRLYGQSMGVSEIALLVSAAFWAFLWGPIGLVLSSPLTVCMVMLGRSVPRLEFLAILLGDEPALDGPVSLYQRLLARDVVEAEALLVEHRETESYEQVFDEMLIPTLSAAKRSRRRGDISEEDERFVCETINRIVDDWSDHEHDNLGAAAQSPEANECPASEGSSPILTFGCPAADVADHVALEMLGKLLSPTCWNLERVAPETLTAELLDQIALKKPRLLCVIATVPGGQAHVRYLCKRVRARFPDLKIVVCRCGNSADNRRDTERLLESGADVITKTLLETRDRMASLRPILASPSSRTVDPSDPVRRTTSRDRRRRAKLNRSSGKPAATPST
jgi:predicted PurR-regulated permease PerM